MDLARSLPAAQTLEQGEDTKPTNLVTDSILTAETNREGAEHQTYEAVVEEKDAHGVDVGHQDVEPQVKLVPVDEQGVREVALSHRLPRQGHHRA